MAATTKIRSSAGFRSIVFFELDATLQVPIGSLVLEPFTPYTVSGSVISGSTVSVAAGATVSGSVGYYGTTQSGAKVLTINDPAPRVLPHLGDDGVVALQVLPPQEAITGELHVDKTNDIVDAIFSPVKSFAVGESNMMAQGTNQRGFEYLVGALAFAAAEDTDPNSSTFGALRWDFRIFPKVDVFMRDTGYGNETNERLYTFAPFFSAAHIWGTQFTNATEGVVRAQMVRGVSQYKPIIVGYKGDGSTVGFPFDSNHPAATAAKIKVWKNGVLLAAGFSVSVSGVSFAVAPLVTDLITVFYETAL